MKKFWLTVSTSTLLIFQGHLAAHCQMPCGIYHDEMVYDQIDQYVETMYKGISALKDNKFTTVVDKNQFVRWVMTKEKLSDEIAQTILTYFLQQKIKPSEADTAKKLEGAHKLLYLLVLIKQNTDIKMVDEFGKEWEKFKLMFHIEGYECKIEMLKMKKLEEKQRQEKLNQDHDHDHDHGHPHTH